MATIVKSISNPPLMLWATFVHYVCTLSVCPSVCVCLCVANILVFYFSAIRRDIDLKFIHDTSRVVLNSLKISKVLISMGWTLPSTGMWRGKVSAISDCLVVYMNLSCFWWGIPVRKPWILYKPPRNETLLGWFFRVLHFVFTLDQFSRTKFWPHWLLCGGKFCHLSP